MATRWWTISRSSSRSHSLTASLPRYAPESTNECALPRVGRARRRPVPCREGVAERALACGALLDRQDGAPAVVVDDREIEPGTLAQELQIGGAFGLGDRQGSDEIPGRDLDGKRVERNAAGIFLALHQDADDTEHRAVPAVGRQREHEIDRVTRRQPSIPITAQNAPQCHAAPGDRDLATHYHVGSPIGADRLHGGAPQCVASETRDAWSGRILVVKECARIAVLAVSRTDICLRGAQAA